jgi:hypothetical protein
MLGAIKIEIKREELDDILSVINKAINTGIVTMFEEESARRFIDRINQHLGIGDY